MQVREPVRISAEALLDQGGLNTLALKLDTHAQRPLTPSCVIADEILGEPAIIEQLFAAQLFDQRLNEDAIEAFLQQFTAQFLGRIAAPRQRVERNDPRCTFLRPRILASQGRYASLTSPPRFMVAFSGINLARICPSMSLEISGCDCRN